MKKIAALITAATISIGTMGAVLPAPGPTSYVKIPHPGPTSY